MVHALLKYGSASIDCQDVHGDTPLHVAAAARHFRVVEELLVSE